MAKGEGDVPRKLLQGEDRGAGTMGKGGEGTDELQGGGGRKIEGEEGQDGDGEPHAWRRREELAPGGGGGDIPIAAAATSSARAAAQMRSSQIAYVRRKETRGIETVPRKGEDDPPQDKRLFGSCGSRGATMMPALEIFLSP